MPALWYWWRTLLLLLWRQVGVEVLAGRRHELLGAVVSGKLAGMKQMYATARHWGCPGVSGQPAARAVVAWSCRWAVWGLLGAAGLPGKSHGVVIWREQA